VTSTLGPQKPWRKCKRSDCLFAADMAGGSPRLSCLWSLRAGQEVASPAFGWHWECPGQNTFSGLKTNFPFHWLFLDLLLSGSDLERERVRV
jgi:hypothetical protein